MNSKHLRTLAVMLAVATVFFALLWAFSQDATMYEPITATVAALAVLFDTLSK